MRKSIDFRKSAAALTSALAFFAPVSARANPQGGQVTGGSAIIQGQGTANVTVTQGTQAAIVNWNSFNIGAGELTRFVQPSSSSVILNRVTGDTSPSSIFGTLSANGQVFLVNPFGFIFGKSATINTAGFVATTADIKNADFLAGRYVFGIPGSAQASIVNQGTITVSGAGIAALVAPAVRNDGVITARLGTVALGAGNAFTLDLYGDNLINFQLNDTVAAQVIDVTTGKPVKSLVENTGTLSANGGTVALTAVTARTLVDSVINNTGIIEAQTVGIQNGKIVLGAPTAGSKAAAAPSQRVVVAGKLDVSGKSSGQKGGTVQITGEAITLTGATIDATGAMGGGKILIGGDFKGGDPNAPAVTQYGQAFETRVVPTATNVSVDQASILNASAITKGNGGKIAVWANDTTVFHGSLFATGGSISGNGGFAEVSGANTVDYSGIKANLYALAGKPGTILFDPTVDTIDANKAYTISVTLSNGTAVVDTADTINVLSSIYKVAGADTSLTFNVLKGFSIGDNVTIGSAVGKLDLAININSYSVSDYQAGMQTAISQLYAAGVSPNVIYNVITNNQPLMVNGQWNPNCCGVYAADFLNYFSSYFTSSFKSSTIYQQIINSYQGSPFIQTSTLSSEINIGNNVHFYLNGGSLSGSTAPLEVIQLNLSIPVYRGFSYGPLQFSPIGVVVYSLPTSNGNYDNLEFKYFQALGGIVSNYDLKVFSKVDINNTVLPYLVILTPPKPPFQTAYQNNPYPFAAFLQSPGINFGSLYDPNLIPLNTDSYGNFIFTGINNRGGRKLASGNYEDKILEKTLELADVYAQLFKVQALKADVARLSQIMVAGDVGRALNEGNYPAAVGSVFAAFAADASMAMFFDISVAACATAVGCLAAPVVVVIGEKVSGQVSDTAYSIGSGMTQQFLGNIN